MRLIDADELFVIDTIEKVNDDVEIVSWIPLRQIEDAPTVEAIPIEWIKLYASYKATRDGMDCYWSMWQEDIHKMIEDWREEND